jgi:3-deoxy-D-manno-octulosonic-acid transferase
MKVLYNLGIFIFSALAHLGSLFNSRASLWVKGRKNWAEKIKDKIKPGDKVIWIHCASLGEFEQGRPVIEAIKQEMPEFKIVLTFFLLQDMKFERTMIMLIALVIFLWIHLAMQQNLRI